MIDIKLLPKDRQSGKLKIGTSTNLSYITFWGENPFTKPIEVSGSLLQNNSGYLLEYTALAVGDFSCGRCGKDVEKSFELSFKHQLLENPEHTEDDHLFVVNDKLDIASIVGEDLVLFLDSDYLCSDDCKGLCSQCGVDLNYKSCNCTKEENLDPRFDVLRELLSKAEQGD